MPPNFIPAPGAAGFQLSNPSVLDVISLYSSLEVFKLAGQVGHSLENGVTKLKVVEDVEKLDMDRVADRRILSELRKKSMNLTSYLEGLLTSSPFYLPVRDLPSTGSSAPVSTLAFTIITPTDPSARGAQLSLLFSPVESMLPIFDSLRQGGVLGDERKPGVIRLAPVPMYNTFEDVRRTAEVLLHAMAAEKKRLSC